MAHLISLPSFFAIQNESNIPIDKSSLFLLPSFPGSSPLGKEMAELLLSYQLEVLNDQTPSYSPQRAVVRIPAGTDPTTLKEHLSQFSELGVRSAALLLNGELGKEDMNSLKLRSIIPRNWLTVALGRVDPSLFPVLVYLGFDIIDIGRAFSAAAKNVRLWPTTAEKVLEVDHQRFCSCRHCSSISDFQEAPSNERLESLTGHNIDLYRQAVSESLGVIQKGRLRWLVESRTHASPAMASILRRIDKEIYEFLEEFTPTTGRGILPLIGPESYRSPAVRRFRERLVERFSPPSHRRIVLLLPCSARKPYSDSKSHRRFSGAIERGMGRSRSTIAETIITSPLGVIPRELERVYPIAQYDIPVSGDWDAEETSIAVDALAQHLSKFGDHAVIVAHVSGGYLDIVNQAESRIRQSIVYTSSEHSAGSRTSLESLSEVLQDLKDKLDLRPSEQTELRDTLRATADFQFGAGAGSLLVPDGAQLRGKLYHMAPCQVEGVQTCSFIGSTGSLSLTMDGGTRLSSLHKYWVRFEGTKIKGGSIFAVGVSEADPIIRPGDEVIVVAKDDSVLAVGKSEMSGMEMCEFEKGRAVSIRHKRK
jgi:archaeosine synthase